MDSIGGELAGRDDAALVENPDINIRGMFSWAKPAQDLIDQGFHLLGVFIAAHLPAGVRFSSHALNAGSSASALLSSVLK